MLYITSYFKKNSFGEGGDEIVQNQKDSSKQNTRLCFRSVVMTGRTCEFDITEKHFKKHGFYIRIAIKLQNFEVGLQLAKFYTRNVRKTDKTDTI
jgi:hypothetical protein